MPFFLDFIKLNVYINKMISPIEFITVRDLFTDNKDRLKLKLVSSENGFNRKITKPDIHRPGLALSGFTDLFTYDRIQVLGNTEMRYLRSLTETKLSKSIDHLKKIYTRAHPSGSDKSVKNKEV